MARMIERKFDPDQPVFVRRFFVAAGRHLEPGTPFKWRSWAIDQRRVRQLFEAGKLMHADEMVTLSVPAEADLAGLQAADQAAYAPAPSIEQEMQDEDIHHAAVTAPTEQEADDLDALNLRELRAIAAEIGAPSRVSREDQREAIRERRRELAGG